MSEKDQLNSANTPTPNGESGNVAQPDDLHNLFEMPLNMDDEDPLAAIRDDPNYSALIKELEYIAAQARLLFEPAGEAPSDKVWEGIQKELGTLPADES